jgi:hypothetical protein
METLFGLGALWTVAAALVTWGLANASAHDEPFRLDTDRLLRR